MPRALPVRFLLCLLLVCVASASEPQSSGAGQATARSAARPPDVVPNQLLIGFQPGTTGAERALIVARGGARLVRHLAAADAALVELPVYRPPGVALAGFAAERAVRYVEPNYRYRAAATPGEPPNDPRWLDGTLWGLEKIGAPEVWETTTGSQGIVVGVVDTGIDHTHEDLAANIWSAPADWDLHGCAPGTHGYSSVLGKIGCEQANTADDHGHGTQVAGVIGARGDNGVGVVGVNWHVSLMSLKAFDHGGVATGASIVDAIGFAIDAKLQEGVNLRVLNLSWGQPDDSPTLRDVMERAREAGILVVVAAGNAGANLDLVPSYPASYGAAPDFLPNIIAVTATNQNDVNWIGFNFGPNTVHLAAPGEGIASTYRGNLYTSSIDPSSIDTSLAAAHVSGAAALLLSAPGLDDLSVAELKMRLLYCGDPLAATGKTITDRRLNVARSLQFADCDVPPYALTTGAVPPEGGVVSVSPQAADYDAGATVTLTATPSSGYRFTGWRNGSSSDGASLGTANPLAIRMSRDREIVALFQPETFLLTLTGTADGQVSATPSAGNHPAGTLITLTATPDAGFVFVNWTLNGTDVRVENPLALTLARDINAHATFAPAPPNCTICQHALHLSWTQGGNVEAAASTWPGDSPYPAGTLVTLTAATNSDYIFAGWTIDGLFQGWANPLTLTMESEHSVVANFAKRRHFTDLPPGPPPYEAISQLAARLIILGYSKGDFGPNDTVQRAQMAALIARAMGWDQEDHGNPFTDDNGIDPNLWRNVGTLAHYNVARGYGDGTFGTLDPVLQVQVISFITRGMVAQGRWVAATTDDPTLYPNVPTSTGHRLDLVTYHRNAGAVPGTIAAQPWAGWTAPSTRGWFAEALWQALDRYYRVDRVP